MQYFAFFCFYVWQLLKLSYHCNAIMHKTNIFNLMKLPVSKGCNPHNYQNKGKKYTPLFTTSEKIQLLLGFLCFFYFLGSALINANI